jgi:hypothetical protein
VQHEKATRRAIFRTHSASCGYYCNGGGFVSAVFDCGGESMITLPRITPANLFKWSCWLIAAVCLWRITSTLVDYLQADPVGYLPSFAQWLMAVFLAVMLFVTARGALQLLNLIWLAGLLAVTAIF